MRNYFHLGLLIVSCFYFAACGETEQAPAKESIKLESSILKSEATSPSVRKEPKELTIHEDTRIDNYYWLNQRENEEVLSYLKAENAYLEKRMAGTKGLQEKLFEEIKGRIKKNDESVPYKDNGYYYYRRYAEGKEYPIYCRKKDNLDATEEIVNDVNTLADGYDYFRATPGTVSPDNSKVAYAVDTVSRRMFTIYIKDLKTGEVFADAIPNANGNIVWANDNKTIFYTTKNKETLRSETIYRHVLGTDYKSDVKIFYEKDETFGCGVTKTKSGAYIMIFSYSTLSTEAQILDADNPMGKFTLFQPRTKNLEYTPTHFEDRFYIITNDKAKNFRLMSTPENKTGIENWEEVIPHREDVLLSGMEIFKEHLVIEERSKGLTHLRVIDWKDNKEHYIDFGEETYVAGISRNKDFDTDILRFNYSSLTTPNSTYDYNLKSRDKELLKRQEIIGGYNPEDYLSERVYANAKDGTKIPVSLVYKKGVKKDGSAPLLLYAYGSYGASMDPYFSSTRLSLLDRGFIFAIAHVRGGQEMGRSWYEDGKLLKKMNTFTDFIACGEHLVKNGYTSKERLFAMGGSAGGLLVGAVVNLAPDLFKGAIASVPFVDVVTTMLDESIPLTTGEFDEWGNPKDKEYYDYMKSYSPYDNVVAQNYPAMLVTTGLHDSQVQYFEPAKWVAKLRELKTDSNPLLFLTNMEAGHGGKSGRFRRYRETAMEYAFMLDLIGVRE